MYPPPLTTPFSSPPPFSHPTSSGPYAHTPLPHIYDRRRYTPQVRIFSTGNIGEGSSRAKIISPQGPDYQTRAGIAPPPSNSTICFRPSPSYPLPEKKFSSLFFPLFCMWEMVRWRNKLETFFGSKRKQDKGKLRLLLQRRGSNLLLYIETPIFPFLLIQLSVFSKDMKCFGLPYKKAKISKKKSRIESRPLISVREQRSAVFRI